MNKTDALTTTRLLAAILLALLLTSCTARPTATPVPLPDSLPASMKGYELYSWRSGEAWHFTLITGTNRQKTVAEVTSAEVTSAEQVLRDDWVKVTLEGVPALKDALARLPPGTEVIWTGTPGLPRGSLVVWARLALPPTAVVDEIRSHCAALDVKLYLSDG